MLELRLAFGTSKGNQSQKDLHLNVFHCVTICYFCQNSRKKLCIMPVLLRERISDFTFPQNDSFDIFFFL